jgi:Leucine-rich repeat (LRR) protein
VKSKLSDLFSILAPHPHHTHTHTHQADNVMKPIPTTGHPTSAMSNFIIIIPIWQLCELVRLELQHCNIMQVYDIQVLKNI